jgi:hypothetical protein
MTAIAKTAPLGERFQVLEGLSDAFLGFPQAHFAHARGVHDEAPAGARKQGSVGRRVAPFAVLPDGPNGLTGLAEPSVDQRRFADTG